MQTRGKKPNDAPWRVGIERPVPGAQDPSSLQTVLTMRRTERLATMTSGTYRHYFDGAGRRYSHILDARSGKPIAHGTVSVTVLHEDPSLADAWSTALLCLGSEEGLAVADREGIATLFVDERDGAFSERPSRAWSELRDVQVE
jgi:thiamine biosynthesis lipoprotein